MVGKTVMEDGTIKFRKPHKAAKKPSDFGKRSSGFPVATRCTRKMIEKTRKMMLTIRTKNLRESTRWETPGLELSSVRVPVKF